MKPTAGLRVVVEIVGEPPDGAVRAFWQLFAELIAESLEDVDSERDVPAQQEEAA